MLIGLFPKIPEAALGIVLEKLAFLGFQRYYWYFANGSRRACGSARQQSCAGSGNKKLAARKLKILPSHNNQICLSGADYIPLNA